MSENEIKPVAWRCIWSKSGKPAWEQYHDESDPMPEQWDVRPNEVRQLYDQAAIDRLLADVVGYKRIADEVAGIIEDAEDRIDRLAAERDDYARAVDFLELEMAKFQIASDEANAERDAAVADAERYRWIRLRIGGAEAVEDNFKWEYESGECLAQDVDAAIDAARAEGE